MSEAARRPERDGGRPPSLNLVAGASVSRKCSSWASSAHPQPQQPLPSRRTRAGEEGAPAWVGGAGRVPEVTCSAREAEAATAVAELHSCGVHPTLTLSLGSNRKSHLHRTSVYEAISTLFWAPSSALPSSRPHGSPTSVSPSSCGELYPSLSLSLNRQHPLSVLWGFSPSEFAGLSGASHPPQPDASPCPSVLKDVSSLSFCLYPRPRNLLRPFFETWKATGSADLVG